MPIVVSRSTGEVVSKPQYSQADYDRAWEAVAKLLQSGILSCCFRSRPPRRDMAMDNQSRQNNFDRLPEYKQVILCRETLARARQTASEPLGDTSGIPPHLESRGTTA